MRRCTFVGCDKALKSRGLCTGHYAQVARGETLRPLQVQYHGLSEVERFLSWVDKRRAAECWEWTGSKNTGYGQWRSGDGDIELAHRAAWRLFKGPIPANDGVLHRCDNPPCVNPRHLFLGSQSDNCHDMWSKGRARPGMSRGEKHGMSKLTEAKVREIRASDEAVSVLAKRMKVSKRTIYDVLSRTIWKHIF